MRHGSGERQGRIFYGWVIVACCLLITLVVFGVIYSFGNFFTSLEEEFQLSRAATSGIFAAYMVLSPAVAVAGGWALDRHGPRIVVAAMGLATGLSMFLTGQVEHVWELYLTYSLLMAVGTGAATNVVMSTGSRWFLRRRGAALGMIGSGCGLGTVIMAPIAAHLIAAFDWRFCLLVLAIAVCTLMLLAAWFLKKEPSAVEAQADGWRDAPLQINTAEVKSAPAGSSLIEAVKTRSYWIFLFNWFSVSFCLHMIMTHIVPRAEDLGIGPVQAASIVGVIGAVSVPSRILGGFLSDTAGRKTIAVVCALLHTLALLWLTASTQMWMFYVFAVLYGIAYGGIDAPILALIGDHFGMRRVGVIMGSLTAGWGAGAALGPYIAGYIYDVSSSYVAAFAMGSAFIALAALVVSRLEKPRAMQHQPEKP